MKIPNIDQDPYLCPGKVKKTQGTIVLAMKVAIQTAKMGKFRKMAKDRKKLTFQNHREVRTGTMAQYPYHLL